MFTVRGIPLRSLGRLIATRAPIADDQPVHVFFCLADHFEPLWNNANRRTQDERVERWRREYPESIAGVFDSSGRPPQHTFFYPQDHYNPRHVDALAELRNSGCADVEVHLHHDNDNSAALRETLHSFAHTLYQTHGLLRLDEAGRPVYGFIHGDWALGNSHPEGRYCGVNEELTILRETGCYADFTLPSAPSPTQTSTINAIYYAIDDPLKPKSHDKGVAARVGRSGPEDGLLMIQGPLTINWRDRIGGICPRIDYANIQGVRAATLERLLRWCAAGVCVEGKPDWRFVKIHTHGCEEANAEILLGQPMRQFHDELARYARDRANFRYHYVTAYEMALLVRQAEQGAEEPDIMRLQKAV